MVVDLPGITRVPVGDQPADVEAQTQEMCLSYIRQPNTLILAVRCAPPCSMHCPAPPRLAARRALLPHHSMMPRLSYPHTSPCAGEPGQLRHRHERRDQAGAGGGPPGGAHHR